MSPRTSTGFLCLAVALVAQAAPDAAPVSTAAADKPALRHRLDAPLLFVKRHPYFSDHIYDDYYTWHPGGGIYVIENPSAAPAEQRVRAIIDPGTSETLGAGVYRDPEISWDGKRVLFAFKGEKDGDTSIYEIGINGRNLRRLTTPGQAGVIACTEQPPPRALGKGRHDISPCYLPDGRIVFTSTRQASRVPCFNSEVDFLHVMNADGSGIHSISVNNVTEFDPAIMSDGRILYGRWEYVDKTALYMQSLWTCNPDGTEETAFFGNNMARPTAFLDARPVPGTHLVVASLTPHNGQSVGAIAMIDVHRGKNGLDAMANLTPEYPKEMDQGLRHGPCDPWPIDSDTVLIANNATNFAHGVIQIISRNGRRELIRSETNIACFSPMLVKARAAPPVIAPVTRHDEPARFLVRDIHEGLTGVKRGEVAWLRVLEETSRISGIPDGGRWWNQAFLVSWQGSYTVKNFLGVVPVQPDGSVWFEAPTGRALYFQALDREGRLLQSMRSFVQAAPGVTRSCVGCHENKATAPVSAAMPLASARAPERLRRESWGSGFVDYPSMVQPVLDRHCVSCHGGEKGIAAGVDLTGGWTWAFNISYETLLKNTLVGFLNCVNEAVKTSELLPPRTHGSGVAPLTKLLVEGHEARIPNISRSERELLLAWMDGNCNYYGTWNWSDHATCEAVLSAGAALAAEMEPAGCVKCHKTIIGNDWINLQTPELSRILRAPLALGETNGLGWCRQRAARASMQLVNQSAQPPDVFKPTRAAARDTNGAMVAVFSSAKDPRYQKMLGIIRRARGQALATPRVDMPGATVRPGECRQLATVPLPRTLPALRAGVEPDGIVVLNWASSAETIGLTFEVHRSAFAGFKPAASTLLLVTPGFDYVDLAASEGAQHYAIVMVTRDGHRSEPLRASIAVPGAITPPAPMNVVARSKPGEVDLEWDALPLFGLRFEVLRARTNGNYETLTPQAIATPFFTDAEPPSDAACRYAIRAVSRKAIKSPLSSDIHAMALPESREPVFVASFHTNVDAQLSGGQQIAGKVAGAASVRGETLDLRKGGHVTFAHRSEFDLKPRISVECWVRFNEAGEIPVILSCGKYEAGGWFLQRFGKGWRWHVGGLNCDGGEAPTNKWVHLLATYDGRRARLFQDGTPVVSKAGTASGALWSGSLYVGQYGAEAGPRFQVNGQIAGVKIHRRAMPAADALAASREAAPQKESM